MNNSTRTFGKQGLNRMTIVGFGNRDNGAVLCKIRIVPFSHNSMNSEMCEHKNNEKEVWRGYENRTAPADRILCSV